MSIDRSKAYQFFSHQKCEYFPCHKGIAEEDFNCLFCYCPFYALGDRCGGSPHYLENGIKDCSRCNFPHQRRNYGVINGRFQELAEIAGMKYKESAINQKE